MSCCHKVISRTAPILLTFGILVAQVASRIGGTVTDSSSAPIAGVKVSFQNLDSSLTKYFSIRENTNLQFRGEFFNVLNHPNWGNPGTTLGTASFGRITSTTGDPRTLQFALKLLF